MTDSPPNPAAPQTRATSTTKSRSLPDNMSDLLATAIADARRLDPETYHPDSDQWHTAVHQWKCEVCLAGSLIAGTLQVSPKHTVFPGMFSDDTEHKLDALDCTRLGAWTLAYHKFYGHEPSFSTAEKLTLLPQPTDRNFTGWAAFRAHLDSMEAIVDQLREIEHNPHPI